VTVTPLPPAYAWPAAEAAGDHKLVALFDRELEAEHQASEHDEAARQTRDTLIAEADLPDTKALVLQARMEAFTAKAADARQAAAEVRQDIERHLEEHAEELQAPLIDQAQASHAHLATAAEAFRAAWEAHARNLWRLFAVQPVARGERELPEHPGIPFRHSGASMAVLVVPRRSSLNVGHAAFRARGEVIARALCRPGTSSRSPWLHPASRRAVAAHVG
jgi:hypothetical protein